MQIQHLLIAGSIACLIASCNNAASEVPHSPQQSTPQQAKATFRSKAPTDKLVSKHLPILGTSAEQLSFKVQDAEAIVSGKPRPTSPITLAVLAGSVPPDIDVCNLPFSALTQAIFLSCIQEGMSYIQVANTIGYAGALTASSKDSETWQWGAGEGRYLLAVFENGKLSSKSQSGLE